MDYERGLEQLKRYTRGNEDHDEFLVYEQQLRDNLHREQYFGTTEQVRSDRAHVVSQLNNLAVRVANVSFNDFCLVAQKAPSSSNSMSSTKLSNTVISASTLPHHVVSASQRSKTYICYHEQEKQYLGELHVHLDQYARKIDYWDTTKIVPGSHRQNVIAKALSETKVAILLISANFLASDFINKYEIPALLEAAAKGEAVLLNIIIRPCAFQYSSLEPYAPVNAEPLITMTPDQRDAVWDSVAMQVQNILHSNP